MEVRLIWVKQVPVEVGPYGTDLPYEPYTP